MAVKWVTQKDYAKRRGVTAQYINKLVTQGKIRKGPGGKIDPRQADAAIRAYSRAGKVIKPTRPKKDKAEKAPKPDSATRSLTKFRAQNEEYKAKTAELEFKKLNGELLPRSEVLLAEQRKNENIRKKFRALPRTIAKLVADASTPAHAEEILRQEIDRLLDELAKDPLGLAEQAAAVEALQASAEVAVA